jgi:hypothetical protein
MQRQDHLWKHITEERHNDVSVAAGVTRAKEGAHGNPAEQEDGIMLGVWQGILRETYPSSLGPNPTKKVGLDGKVKSLELSHPLHPDAFYEVAGYPLVVIDSTQGVYTQRRRVLDTSKSTSARKLSSVFEGRMLHSL